MTSTQQIMFCDDWRFSAVWGSICHKKSRLPIAGTWNFYSRLSFFQPAFSTFCWMDVLNVSCCKMGFLLFFLPICRRLITCYLGQRFGCPTNIGPRKEPSWLTTPENLAKFDPLDWVSDLFEGSVNSKQGHRSALFASPVCIRQGVLLRNSRYQFETCTVPRESMFSMYADIPCWVLRCNKARMLFEWHVLYIQENPTISILW